MLARFAFAALTTAVLVVPVAAESAASTAPGPKEQVKIEVKFITVADDFFSRIGVNFYLNGKKMEIPDNAAEVDKIIGLEPANEKEPIFLDDKEFHNFLETLQGDVRTNFEDALKAVVSNGKTAVWERTHKHPCGTTSSESVSSGYKVSILPRIVDDRRAVALKLKLSLTNPDAETLSLTDELTIPAGHTVVLGGWKRVTEGRNEYGPPVVSNIPYVGRLFRKVGYQRVTEKVLVLVTATLVDQENK